MQIVTSPSQEIKPMSNFESARIAAITRIHAEELDRMEAQLVAYELERANAKFMVRQICKQFGANHVAAWVVQSADDLGQSI